ncbi:MAG: sphinganine kinase lcb4 [Pycnora praestabilis]|nr:MAG: sphinganine kinase lcb4 [Pycnora praestabilis]
MASLPAKNGDPFADTNVVEDQRESMEESTLTVGRNASLTLGTDSLIVLDEGFVERNGSNCCGLIPSKNKTTRAIPFFNVLWADLDTFELTVRFAHQINKKDVRVAFINYGVEKTERAKATAWIARLLDRAYGVSQRQKRIKVLINPFGGKGHAQKLYLRDIEPIFAAARCEVDVEKTQYCGHAVEIAEKLDTDGFDVIASCSGDGLPHEVFNGLGKKKDAMRALSNIAVVQLPCGTGNAMSLNLNGTDSNSLAALCVVKGIKTPLDLISITQGDRRTLSFLSQAVGIVAESDLGTEHMRWMGSARFTYGFLVRLFGKICYPCDIAVKVDIGDKAAIRERYQQELSNDTPINERRENISTNSNSNSSSSEAEEGLPHLQYGTVGDKLPPDWQLVPYDKLGNFYAGNMAYMAADTNFFPATLPSDGSLDLVCMNGDVGHIAAVQSLMALGNNTLFDMPHVCYRKVSGYRIIPRGQRNGYISIDGERVPFEPFQAEVHRGLGTVLSKSGHVYEGPGPGVL